ncbi:outer membrane transport energization protein TonB [Pseudomonas fluorescens Pf0-1]|uniref:Protein TonB n=2 Tax=Pseudomonas TaxID=286 RepID=Q3K4W8_PSEPF|nr:outer membrane transport energization protein TonB [Pseudomonas fluorescens Pf0-1]
MLLPVRHFSLKGWVMRWFFALVLLALMGIAGAAEVVLIPDNNPGPVYPRELAKAGVMGEVRVRFTANADGSVSDIAILESEHPDFSAAVTDALRQWRFRSWTVEAGKPAEMEVIAPMFFRLDIDSPIHANQWLRRVRCVDLHQYAIRRPVSSWVHLPVFHYTRAYLSSVVYTSQLSNERRLGLIAKLNERARYIIDRCGKSPNSRYVNLLPEDIRELL